MKGHGQKMTRTKEKAVAALLSEPTIAAAAKRAGIAESTILRWLKLPEFAELYRQGKRESVGAAVSSLQRACCDATNALREIAANKQAPASARVSAARSILEIGFKAIELEDVLTRLERLEESENAKGHY